MLMGELIVAAILVTCIAKAVKRGRSFDCAWVGLFVGLALLCSRGMVALGAVTAALSFAVLTLPMARVEWQRRTGVSARTQAPRG